LHQFENLRLSLGVQAVGGFIQKNDFRIMHNGLRQLEPLLHAGRVSVNLAVTLLAHPDEIEHFMRALPRRLKGQPGQLRAIGDIFAAGHAGDVAILFRRVTDALANLPSFAPHLASEQFGRAGRDGLQLQEAFHEGAFARAVGPSRPMAPGETLRLTLSKARCRPKTFERPSVSMTGSDVILRGTV
jgi:hypothetical protein